MSTPVLARAFGRWLQGVVLGTLLFAALIELATTAVGAQIFRYQGF